MQFIQASFDCNYLSLGNYVIEYCISGCDGVHCGKEGSLEEKVPKMHSYSFVIK